MPTFDLPSLHPFARRTSSAASRPAPFRPFSRFPVRGVFVSSGNPSVMLARERPDGVNNAEPIRTADSLALLLHCLTLEGI